MFLLPNEIDVDVFEDGCGAVVLYWGHGARGVLIDWVMGWVSSCHKLLRFLFF